MEPLGEGYIMQARVAVLLAGKVHAHVAMALECLCSLILIGLEQDDVKRRKNARKKCKADARECASVLP